MANTIRFTGIASGLDTESIVKAMLTPYQSKIDTAQQKQTMMEWKQEAWKDMNAKVNKFYDNYVTKLSRVGTISANKITSSNTSALDVKSSGTLPQGSHNISIENIATSAQVIGNKTNLSVSTLSGTTTLKELGITKETTIEIQKLEDNKVVTPEPPATNVQITLQPGETLADVQAKLADAGVVLEINEGKVSLKNETAGATGEGVKLQATSGDVSVFSKLGVSSTTIMEDKTVTGKNLDTLSKDISIGRLGISTGKITINNTTVDVTEDMTLSELEKALKVGNDDLNINLDLSQGRFFISSKATGKEAEINISGDAALLSGLGLSAVNETGEDAKYTYNGQSFESSSNTVSINGLELTLKDKADNINLNITQDTTEVVGFVKEFVGAYNELIEEINTLLGEKSSSSYGPLTDAQREEMSDKEIELWEKKAKQGLFYRDPQLTKLKDDMRSILGKVVPGSEYSTLNSIGISTGNWKENGKLYLDEAKLTEALQKNPDDVVKLFTGQGNREQVMEDYITKNVAAELAKDDNTKTEDELRKEFQATYNKMTTAQKDLLTKESNGVFTNLKASFDVMLASNSVKSYGSFYNDKALVKQMTEATTKMSKLQERYTSMETLYYKKFTAMEKMISQLNSQSSWLSQ